MADRAGGRRDRSRERLYGAALALVAERGFEATTMDDIAERAGVSRRTAFNHFPAKGDFTLEWVARRRDAAIAAIDDVPADDAAGRLRAWFRALGELTDAHPEETGQMMLGWLAVGGPVRNPTGTGETLVPWLVDGAREGSLDGAVDAELAAGLLVDAHLGVLYRWFASPRVERGAVGPRIDAAIDLVLRGLVARR